MGDASHSLNRNYSHKIMLRVIDKEFADEFARCLSVVLKRSIPPVRRIPSSQLWRTEASSVLLRHFLLQPLKSLRPIMEYSKECSSAFLRGFFDSEASMSGRVLCVSNSDFDLLLYLRHLLWERFRIETTGPHLHREAGGTVMIKGSRFRVNKNHYAVRVRTFSLCAFRDNVSFTLARKRTPLEDATKK